MQIITIHPSNAGRYYEPIEAENLESMAEAIYDELVGGYFDMAQWEAVEARFDSEEYLAYAEEPVEPAEITEELVRDMASHLWDCPLKHVKVVDNA